MSKREAKEEVDTSSAANATSSSSAYVRDLDRLLPIANITRIMKRGEQPQLIRFELAESFLFDISSTKWGQDVAAVARGCAIVRL
jgi:histone H3/H4